MEQLDKSGIPRYAGPGVYKISCGATGWVYIGASSSVRKRLLYHRNKLRAGSHHCAALQYAFVAQGENNLSFEVLLRCATDEEAYIKEVEFADAETAPLFSRTKKKFKSTWSTDPEKKGRRAAKNASAWQRQWSDPKYKEERSAQLSAQKKELWENDPEYKKRQLAGLAKQNKAQWADPAYRKRQSASSSANLNKLWQNPEFRRKISEARKKQWADPAFRAKMTAPRRKNSTS